MTPLSFVVPVGNREVFERCFAASPLWIEEAGHEILPQEGFRTASEALNDGIDRASHDILVFAHEDVVLPRGWGLRFRAQWVLLQEAGARVGVVGCVGITSGGVKAGHVYRHDREYLLEPALPMRVKTLDELLIGFRKDSGLRFDENLPGFYNFAADICLEAESRGLENYALDIPCFHQAKDRSRLPRQYFTGAEYLLEKWRDSLPIHTLSFVLDGRYRLWKRRLEQFLWPILPVPPPWWKNLPRIDPSKVLFESNFEDAVEGGKPSEESGSSR